jgi:hypothetical protein
VHQAELYINFFKIRTGGSFQYLRINRNWNPSFSSKSRTGQQHWCRQHRCCRHSCNWLDSKTMKMYAQKSHNGKTWSSQEKLMYKVVDGSQVDPKQGVRALCGWLGSSHCLSTSKETWLTHFGQLHKLPPIITLMAHVVLSSWRANAPTIITLQWSKMNYWVMGPCGDCFVYSSFVRYCTYDRCLAQHNLQNI